jgi:hypothetical protein
LASLSITAPVSAVLTTATFVTGLTTASVAKLAILCQLITLAVVSVHPTAPVVGPAKLVESVSQTSLL